MLHPTAVNLDQRESHESIRCAISIRCHGLPKFRSTTFFL